MSNELKPLSVNDIEDSQVNEISDWLEILARERGVLGTGERVGVGTKKDVPRYPENYLVVLSVVAKVRSPKDETEEELVRHWVELVESVNNGIFDPVVLYDLMK